MRGRFSIANELIARTASGQSFVYPANALNELTGHVVTMIYFSGYSRKVARRRGQDGGRRKFELENRKGELERLKVRAFEG